MTHVVPITYLKPAWGGEPLNLRLEVLKEWRARQDYNTAVPSPGQTPEQFASATVQRFNAYRSKNYHARRLTRCLVIPAEQLDIERGAREAALACRLGLEQARKTSGVVVNKL